MSACSSTIPSSLPAKMDQAAATNTPYTLEQGESSTVDLMMRDQDALSQALRQGHISTMDDIARLAKEAPTAYETLSSLASTETMVFTSRDHSSVTKPTSVTTSRPLVHTRNSGKGKGKPKVHHTASLSGTNGSASGAEAERRDARRNDLLAMGSWANSNLIVTMPLKGAARGKGRTKLKQSKKFDIVLTHGGDARTPLLVQDHKSLLPHNPDYRGDMLSITEDGLSQASTAENMALVSSCWTRTIGIVTLFVLKTLVLAFAILAAYNTGNEHKIHIKAIVLATSVCMAYLTILAMLLARRAVLEALLAGLMELVLGLTILTGLDDFI